MAATDYPALSQFLYHEAALLDAREWDAWGALFSVDGIYWVPAASGQQDPVHHVSLVYDDALLRAIRLNRLKESDAASLQVRPASSHLVANIVITAADASAGRYTLRSRFVVGQHAPWGMRTFQGAYTHELRWEEQGLRIVRKRVDLLGVDGPLDDILIIL